MGGVATGVLGHKVWHPTLGTHTHVMLGTSPFPTHPRCTSMVCVMEEIGGGKTTEERKGEEEDKMIKREDEAMMEKDEGIMNFFL